MLFTPWLRSLKFSARHTRTSRSRRRRRPIPLFGIESLEDRTLLAAALIVVTDPVGPNDLSLRLNGANLEVFDNIGSTVIASQALAVKTGVQLIGADNVNDTFTIDYGFGGVFSLVDGINVNGGTGINSDSLIVITETGDVNQFVDVRGTFITSRNRGGGSSILRIDYTGIDALAVETGDGDDLINVRMGGLPAVVNIDGGPQSLNETLKVFGTSGDDIIVVTTSQVTFGNPVVGTINYGDIEELIIDGRGGNDDITDLRNTPTTTTGISNVTADEDAPDTVIDLFAVFDDAQDADLDLVFTIEANSNVALFSGTPIDGGLGTLTLDYASDSNGTAEITVRATDSGGLFVETTFTVTVNSINDVPIANAGQNQTVLERTLVTLDGSASSDVDGDSLTFAWLQTVGPTVTLSAPGGAITEFTAPVVLSRNTQVTFELTVTDPFLATGVDTVTISVNPDLTIDSDGDGIIDRIDTQPDAFSNAFGDDNLYGDGQVVGGTTFGRITEKRRRNIPNH